MQPSNHEIRNIGLVSSRACGTDGVSLEVGKWAAILERLGYDCFYARRPIRTRYSRVDCKLSTAVGR
jgi:hypothetical protein